MKVHLWGLENNKTRKEQEDRKLWYIDIFKEEKKETSVCCVWAHWEQIYNTYREFQNELVIYM